MGQGQRRSVRERKAILRTSLAGGKSFSQAPGVPGQEGTGDCTSVTWYQLDHPAILVSLTNYPETPLVPATVIIMIRKQEWRQ